jgi:hypothetical protein
MFGYKSLLITIVYLGENVDIRRLNSSFGLYPTPSYGEKSRSDKFGDQGSLLGGDIIARRKL